ncbi:MAG TPA: CPBP family glutamic-type intramembrane protease [Polyangiaceae bacterium]
MGGAVLERTALLAEGLQAFLAEWGATRLGAAWLDPRCEEAGRALAAREAARGVVQGALAGGAGLLVARMTHAIPAIAPHWAIVPLAVATVDAAVVSVRDEMLLRGVVLRVAGDRPRPFALVATALASVAWRLGVQGEAGVPLVDLLGEAAAGAWFGALWLRHRGGVVAWGAHTAWLMVATAAGVSPSALTGSWGVSIPLIAALAFTLRPETSAAPEAVG